MAEECKCIILNKAFEGAWNDKDGNISHEIIDFFKADDKKYYIYNSPYGTLRRGIYVNKYEDEYVYNPEKDKKNYSKDDIKVAQVEYLVIASPATIVKIKDNQVEKKEKESTFKIKYLIKLKRRIQNPDGSDFSPKYAGKELKQILNVPDKYPLITFEAEWIKEPKKIKEVTTKDYTYQRNRGYVYNDTCPQSYNALINAIEDIEENGTTLKIMPISKEEVNNHKDENAKTFLDMIRKTENEESYTNLLYEILNYKKVFNRFLEYLKIDVKNEEFKVEREKGIKGGRMDISAESKSKKYRVFIENKVLSGLNGTKNNHSQITTYYKWANDKHEPLGFVLVPDYKVSDIKKELELYKENEICKIIEYSKIKEFLNQVISENKDKDFWKDFKYEKYLSDMVPIFNKYSFKNKLDKFKNDFIEAIKLCN